jgi:hypothetical protein
MSRPYREPARRLRRAQALADVLVVDACVREELTEERSLVSAARADWPAGTARLLG